MSDLMMRTREALSELACGAVWLVRRRHKDAASAAMNELKDKALLQGLADGLHADARRARAEAVSLAGANAGLRSELEEAKKDLDALQSCLDAAVRQRDDLVASVERVRAREADFQRKYHDANSALAIREAELEGAVARERQAARALDQARLDQKTLAWSAGETAELLRAEQDKATRLLEALAGVARCVKTAQDTVVPF